MASLRWSAVLVVLVVACGGGGDGSARPDAAAPAEDVTSTSGPDATVRAEVVEAWEAAIAAKAASLAPPAAQPELPALHETLTGLELEWARSHAARSLQGGYSYRPRAGGRDRDVVLSVTLPDDDEPADVAWVEACQVEDIERLIDGQHFPDLDRYDPMRTFQYTDELRRVAGGWRLAARDVHGWTEGETGCALADPPTAAPGAAPDDQRQAVTDARARAEEAWLSAIVDPSTPPPVDSYTGYLLRWFSPDADDQLDPPSQVVYRECPIGTPERPNIIEGGNDPCVRKAWFGTQVATFALRQLGNAFDPTSTSVVAVDSSTWQDVETPTVAYLRTCRTYDLRLASGEAYPYARATVRATELMRLEGETWKLAARWDFDVDETAAPC